jgi:hypothetical protein
MKKDGYPKDFAYTHSWALRHSSGLWERIAERLKSNWAFASIFLSGFSPVRCPDVFLTLLQ